MPLLTLLFSLTSPSATCPGYRSMSFPPDSEAMEKINTAMAAGVDAQFQQFLKTDSEESRRGLIQHWHLWEQRHKDRLLQSHFALSEAIRTALHGDDLHVKSNAFQAITELIDFELLGDLVKFTIQPNFAHKETSGQVLSSLVVDFFHHHQKQETAEAQAITQRLIDSGDSQQPTEVSEATSSAASRFQWPANRRHLQKQLEHAVQNYRQHQRSEILLAYLLFADYSDAFINRALSLETHEAHGDLISLLYESRTPPIVEKLAGYVTVKNPPPKLARLWNRRKDWGFVQAFLEAISQGLPQVVAANIQRLDRPVWLESTLERARELPVAQQLGLMQVLVRSITDHETRLEWLMRLLSVAAPPVRRQTVKHICETPGIRANKVVSYLVDQEQDAECLAMLLPELRRRNIRGAMRRLLAFLDHSSPEVRLAAGGAFEDCRVERYLAAFDMLGQSVRLSTGQLVRKVDPNTNRVLKEELYGNARPRRLRALIAIRCIGNAQDMQEALFHCLKDEDPKIREATVGTLAYSKTMEAQRQLRGALLDQDPRVKAAAQRALENMAHGGGNS